MGQGRTHRRRDHQGIIVLTHQAGEGGPGGGILPFAETVGHLLAHGGVGIVDERENGGEQLGTCFSKSIGESNGFPANRWMGIFQGPHNMGRRELSEQVESGQGLDAGLGSR